MARKILWVDEKTKTKDVSGKIYIVTGANSGVGLETTRQLIKQGGHVIMACRRVGAAQEVAQEFEGLKGSHEVIKLDLASLDSVRSFVKAFLKKHDRLDGLVCNAGLVTMGSEPMRTKEGFEMAIGVSYFGHFLLTELLLDTLKKSAPSRVAILSSVVHAGSDRNRPDIHFEDINYHTRKYNNFAAYGEAKLAVVLYAKELGERLKGAGVSVFSVHPGWARSNFGKGGNLLMRSIMAIMSPLTRGISDSNEESAQTSLHCMLSEDAPKHSGEYFSQSSVLYRDNECKAGGWPMKSPNPHANDMIKAKKLVDMTYPLVGLTAGDEYRIADNS